MPGTFSEEYPEEYEYFRARLSSTLSSGELEPEQIPIVRSALDDLATRVVTSKCGCGQPDCKTFTFEAKLEESFGHLDLSGTPEVILFHRDDGEMHMLEQYPTS